MTLGLFPALYRFLLPKFLSMCPGPHLGLFKMVRYLFCSSCLYSNLIFYQSYFHINFYFNNGMSVRIKIISRGIYIMHGIRNSYLHVTVYEAYLSKLVAKQFMCPRQVPWCITFSLRIRGTVYSQRSIYVFDRLPKIGKCQRRIRHAYL